MQKQLRLLNEYRDTTAHYFDGRVYVLCHWCGQRTPALSHLNWDHSCKNCRHFRKFIWKLQPHISLSTRNGFATTLTKRQWYRCLNFFEFTCAYCGADFEEIEHFMPTRWGGGTTVYNCLPSCESCNYRKLRIFNQLGVPRELATRLKAYFSLPDLDNPPFIIN